MSLHFHSDTLDFVKKVFQREGILLPNTFYGGITPKQSGLNLALTAYRDGSTEAWEWINENEINELTIADFKAAPQSDMFKGESGISLAAKAAQNGRSEALNVIIKRFRNEMDISDLKVITQNPLKVPESIAHPTKGTYYLDTTKIYKMWFSKHPSEAFNNENKVRLIKLVEQNPEVQVTLIYSSETLLPEAITDLKTFCEHLNVKLVDFDNDIEDILTADNDKELYRLAKLEIKHARNKTGGNLASAADCVKLIYPVINKYGIYMDCDVASDFSQLPPVLHVSSPLVLNVENMRLNNNFIGLPYASRDLSSRDPESISKLRCVQQRVIRNYKALTLTTIDNELKRDVSQDKSFNELRHRYVAKVLEKFPQADIFTLRTHIVTDPGLQPIERKSLYYASVISIAGPGAYYELLLEIVNHNLGRQIKSLSDLSVDDAIALGVVLETYGLKANGLAKCVNFQTGVNGDKDSSASGDRSWTPEGEALQAQRSKVMASEVEELLRRFASMRLEKAQGVVSSTSSTSISSTSTSSTSKPLFTPGFLLKSSIPKPNPAPAPSDANGSKLKGGFFNKTG